MKEDTALRAESSIWWDWEKPHLAWRSTLINTHTDMMHSYLSCTGRFFDAIVHGNIRQEYHLRTRFYILCITIRSTCFWGQKRYYIKLNLSSDNTTYNITLPLKCFSRNLQFPHRVPFTKEKMPQCPSPFKNKAYKHEYFKLIYLFTL